ncbi:cytochrome b [Tahibacter harae]|uniref:Cytochrome b/b6 domain-containing protein n=1 Tax=Tahibacter harae TaxID=2963937 RepID=A0ABT1QWZ1_9GAMM|nr:cytochrome b/b6 domain-containing protein [Tahibacter harae]MCQ4166806.1 cytochrome b/b6 domain-containing protein [Tahibacter harae]
MSTDESTAAAAVHSIPAASAPSSAPSAQGAAVAGAPTQLPVPAHFNAAARLLHWLMAPLILAMLFVGVAMMASVHNRPWMVDLHRPLGIAILALALLRLGNRLRHPPPPLPADLPRWQARAAVASHWLLYALFIAMPLIGWAMLSAGGYPVEMIGGLHLPPLLPQDVTLYAVLRTAHGWLAKLLFATVLLHLAAALFHAWVRRDGVFSSMARGRSAPD